MNKKTQKKSKLTQLYNTVYTKTCSLSRMFSALFVPAQQFSCFARYVIINNTWQCGETSNKKKISKTAKIIVLLCHLQANSVWGIDNTYLVIR